MTYIENSNSLPKDEVFIKVEKKFEHPCSSSNDKTIPQKEESKRFVTDFFTSNGTKIDESQWQSSKEVVIDDCPSSTLHQLTLEAKRQGKTVTYSNSLIIKISE